jgi:small subunit ribosomal protein S20
LANSPSAKKRARQQEKRRQHNASLRSRLRTHIKKVQKAVDTGDQTAAVQLLQQATPVIDAMTNKGIIHRNKAARHKSRLNRKVKALTQQSG